MTLKRYIFPLNSIRSYFNGGLSFVVFSIVEGNVNIFSAVFCGITKRYALIIWAGLRHFVPKHHVKNSHCLRSEISLILTIDNKEFDLLEKRLKDYYMLIKRIIAQCPKTPNTCVKISI